jgi:small neutral amino acid transporter SnatA (MarC family)
MSTNCKYAHKIDVPHLFFFFFFFFFFLIGVQKWCKTMNIHVNGWKVMGSYILTLTMEEKLGREQEEKHFFL